MQEQIDQALSNLVEAEDMENYPVLTLALKQVTSQLQKIHKKAKLKEE